MSFENILSSSGALSFFHLEPRGHETVCHSRDWLD